MAILGDDELTKLKSNLPALDFVDEVQADPLGSEWTYLGLRTHGRPPRTDRVETVVERQSMLIDVDAFASAFEKLESIGNVLHGIGKPAQVQVGDTYAYDPFYRFRISFTDVFVEPLVFRNSQHGVGEFTVNPDIICFLGLSETGSEQRAWTDPRHGSEVLRCRRDDESHIDLVEIRTRYLQKYLGARQKALLFGHYRHYHIYDPTDEEKNQYGATGDVEIGNPNSKVKVVLHNWGYRNDGLGETYLQRRLHLWRVVDPPEIDIEDPWAADPPFDAASFTFPTAHGDVAPARWKHFKGSDTAQFAGVSADFTTPVCFRQEVLQKYQGAAGFEVLDNGSVVCGHYWGLQRSTERIGNELLTTLIGDFAEGVPFEEWNHWKQHAVGPPSTEDFERMRSEQTIPDAVNELVNALRDLNDAVRERAASLALDDPEDIWCGLLDSLAAKQMKWVYPIGSGDGEFLTRATLASTLVVDEIVPGVIRKLLREFGEGLERKDPTEGGSQTLRSRNLLQRLALTCRVADEISPGKESMGELISQAEAVKPAEGATDLGIELSGYFAEVRGSMGALAFLYDIRTHGGIAHSPSPDKAATAARELGLPSSGWRRSDYLELLSLVAGSVRMVAETIQP